MLSHKMQVCVLKNYFTFAKTPKIQVSVLKNYFTCTKTLKIQGTELKYGQNKNKCEK